MDAVVRSGAESLLWLNLVQYADPEQFAAFADELLERSAKTAITMEVSTEATRGELWTTLGRDQIIRLGKLYDDQNYARADRETSLLRVGDLALLDVRQFLGFLSDLAGV